MKNIDIILSSPTAAGRASSQALTTHELTGFDVGAAGVHDEGRRRLRHRHLGGWHFFTKLYLGPVALSDKFVKTITKGWWKPSQRAGNSNLKNAVDEKRETWIRDVKRCRRYDSCIPCTV